MLNYSYAQFYQQIQSEFKNNTLSFAYFSGMFYNTRADSKIIDFKENYIATKTCGKRL